MSNVLDDSQFQTSRAYVEGIWLHGAFITAVLYGVVVVLYVMCARSLWVRIRFHGRARTKRWFLFVYVNFIFALSTLYVTANVQVTQLGFVNNRDYPGGPGAYESHTPSVPLNIAFVLSNWCADALMVWRCHVLYKDSKYHHFVTGSSCLMLLASIVTSSIWVVIVSQPARSTTDWMSSALLFPFLSVSLAINIFICTLTVLRLLYYRACISKTFGPECGIVYANFAATIVESAAIYSICSLLYLIPHAVNSPLANAFLQILGEAQIIAPLLIIYRVSEGTAWTRDVNRCLASPGPFALRGMATTCSSPIGFQAPRSLDVRVSFQGAQHAECGDSIQPENEQDKSLTV